MVLKTKTNNILFFGPNHLRKIKRHIDLACCDGKQNIDEYRSSEHHKKNIVEIIINRKKSPSSFLILSNCGDLMEKEDSDGNYRSDF